LVPDVQCLAAVSI